MTELQILREHSDYLSVIAVHRDTVVSASGDQHIYLHRRVDTRASNEGHPRVRKDFTINQEKALVGAFSVIVKSSGTFG